MVAALEVLFSAETCAWILSWRRIWKKTDCLARISALTRVAILLVRLRDSKE